MIAYNNIRIFELRIKSHDVFKGSKGTLFFFSFIFVLKMHGLMTLSHSRAYIILLYSRNKKRRTKRQKIRSLSTKKKRLYTIRYTEDYKLRVLKSEIMICIDQIYYSENFD
ncbi:hypothetical protein BpHYR1_039864 [Brachionus plicatilis]|uniref:Uncharacterized protein n=1 Tax=Brachionus plicatilis TaxID=10195 RepID=A0A3M7RJU8_BRAPC|nr:hypothetical protein BpHYR1_039864 [Brachionus plicatilis]